MNFSLPVSLSFVYLVVLLNLLLAGLVYMQNRKNATNIVFALLSLVTSAWVLVIFIASEPLSIFWARLSIVLASPMTALFFLFAHTYPYKHVRVSHKGQILIWLVTILSMIAAGSKYSFMEIDHSGGVDRFVTGPGMVVFGLITTYFSAGAIAFFIKKLHSSKGKVRQQLRMVLTGILTMFGLIIGTIFLPVLLYNTSQFVVYAPLYVFVFLFLTAYAILKHSLFDLRFLVTEALVVLLVMSLIFDMFNAPSLLVLSYKIGFVISALVIGIWLIKSVKNEIDQKEELAQLAKNFEKANIQLKELDRTKTEFLSIASHQLRTPLSIIKGYLELVGDGAYGKVTKKMKSVFHDMDVSNERLVKLVDEFLDISRIEQGRTKFSFVEGNMHTVIDSVVHEIAERATRKGLTIKWGRNQRVPSSTFDVEKIRHVVFNFVDNAIKYSEKGSINIQLSSEHGYISVAVKDKGLGFNNVDEANFFNKFYRGKNVEGINVNGTGLGIYVAKKFVEAHHGDVWAKSAGMGKGSEFGFRIPTDLKPTIRKKKNSVQ